MKSTVNKRMSAHRSEHLWCVSCTESLQEDSLKCHRVKHCIHGFNTSPKLMQYKVSPQWSTEDRLRKKSSQVLSVWESKTCHVFLPTSKLILGNLIVAGNHIITVDVLAEPWCCREIQPAAMRAAFTEANKQIAQKALIL